MIREDGMIAMMLSADYVVEVVCRERWLVLPNRVIAAVSLPYRVSCCIGLSRARNGNHMPPARPGDGRRLDI